MASHCTRCGTANYSNTATCPNPSCYQTQGQQASQPDPKRCVCGAWIEPRTIHRCQPDPKDARIAELERSTADHIKAWVGRVDEVIALTDERSELRARVAELESRIDSQNEVIANYRAPMEELAAARAECERLSARCDEWVKYLRTEHERIQSLESGAGRLREEMGKIRENASRSPIHTTLWHLANQALAETDAGKRALAVIEAARKAAKHLTIFNSTSGYRGGEQQTLDAINKALALWDQGAGDGEAT